MNQNTLAAIVSIGAGSTTVLGAIAIIMRATGVRIPTPKASKEGVSPLGGLEIDQDAVRWAMWWACQSMVLFYVLIGGVLLFAPRWVFGRTWYVYADLPHGGWGMGLACLGLAVAMVVSILLRSKRLVSSVLFAGGITFWIAAFLVASQGISAKSECIETLFMMYAAVDMLIKGAVIRR